MRPFTKTFKKIMANYDEGKYGKCESIGDVFIDAGFPTFFKDASIDDLQDVLRNSDRYGMLRMMFSLMTRGKRKEKDVGMEKSYGKHYLFFDKQKNYF